MNTLTLNDYQKLSQETANYPRHSGFNIAYPALGLAGESGEVANEIKKIFRDDNGELTPERRTKLIDESGDCLWYIAALAGELGVDLEEIASYNLAKLKKRHKMVPTEVPISEYEAHLAKMKPTRESDK